MQQIDTTAIRERLGAFLASDGTVKTKTNVARKLGVSLNTLNAKLNGETPFTFTQAAALADLIGCTMDDLRSRPFD